ncbi:MAG: C25 family cysteine peptidase [Bacteroidota bacterium]
MLLCTAISCVTYAQMNINGNTLYGNEWIDYGQFYYKVPIVEDGVYRLTYQELQNAGVFSESTVPTGANFQIFHQGEEIPVYVTTTGSFTSGDYIEFYGEQNDGGLDSHLYQSSRRDQLNPEYSMYTDTAIYFLTWNGLSSNNRYTTEINNITNPPAAEPYFWYEDKIVYGGNYQQGEDKTGNGLGLAPRYGLAEGYATKTFVEDQTVDLSFQNPYLNGPNANVQLRLGTRSGNHDLRILFNGDTTVYSSFNGWTASNYSFSTSTSNVSTNDELRILGVNSANDEYIIASIISTYPRTFDFNNASTLFFRIPSNNTDRYLEITNFNHGGVAPVIYDVTNKRRLVTDLDNGVVKVLLSPFSGERQLALVSDADVKSATSIDKKVFANFDFSASGTDYDYIILSHPKLIDDSNNYVQQYANYRSSAAGGNYTPLIVDVTDLYDQFSYGIVRHELGIRNFLKLADLNWDTDYLFIIGKGEQRQRVRSGNYNTNYDLVPPFGYPNSDYLFVVDNDATTTEPWMAVGRIGAFQADQVRIYLKKIEEHEAALNGVSQTIDDVSWTKRVLHFAGGDAAIESAILNDMETLKGILETSTFGADVIPFSKSDTDIGSYRSVPNFINEGTSMMTFYGHSTAQSLDFDIGSPENYTNNGRYPFFYAIGCNTNKLYEGLITLSEDYVFVEDKGAVGFFGSTWLTGLSNLGDYAEIFYRNLGTDMYGSTVGQITVETTKEYTNTSSFTAQQLAQVYTLHGDPAIRLYPFDAPDYITNEESSQVAPDLIDITADSVTLELTVTNIGQNVSGMLDVQLEHQLPNSNLEALQTLQIPAPAYDTSIVITLPIVDAASVKGKNYIRVTLDPSNNFSEGPIGAETNNTLLIPFYIVESDVIAVYPRNYGIVEQQGVTLRSSTTNPFALSTTYAIEIDTTTSFDSPVKLSQTMVQAGGVIEWTPSITLVDNTTYYWRVSPDASETFGKGYDWDMHSFTFIQNCDDGWMQQDYYQFQDDLLTNMSLDSASQKLMFNEILSDIRVTTGTLPNLGFADIAVFKDGFNLFSYSPCGQGTEAIYVAVFDPETLLIRRRGPNDPSFNCFNSGGFVFIGNVRLQSERDRLIDFLNNYIRPDDYAVVFTTKSRNNSYNAGDWAADSISNNGDNIFNLLEAQGATRIREMEDSETPYIFIFQQDNPDYQTVEVKAEGEENLEARAVIIGSQNEGTLSTPRIGPAMSWETLKWMVYDTTAASDEVSIDVYGIDLNNQETLLLDDITDENTSLASIDAATHPYLRLEYFTKDEANTSPAQIGFLKVLYNNGSESTTTGVAELALAANIKYHFHKEILGKGDQVQLKLGIANLSDEVANHVQTSVQITDDNTIDLTFLDTIPQIDPQSSQELDFILDSDILVEGNFELNVITNANNTILEETYENNSGTIDFDVEECLADVFVATDYERGTPIVRVSNTITSERVIESAANVVFTAGTSVTLLPGFHAQANSEFHALIGGCSLSQISQIPEGEENTAELRTEEIGLEASSTLESVMEVQVAPNPASSNVNISFDLPQNGRVKVSLMDLNGQILAETYEADTAKGWNQTTLELGNLNSGMYLIVLQNEQTTIVKKLMIER